MSTKESVEFEGETYARKGLLAAFVDTVRLGIAGSLTLGLDGLSGSTYGGVGSPPDISFNQDMRLDGN